jgi:DnaJ-class molecular chaperone
MSAVELQRAYQILGVSSSASAHSIKHAYRELVKRWHPDLYQTGTAAHAEATEMTRTINEAYSAIEHAPLRYYVDAGGPTPPRTTVNAATPGVGRESTKKASEAFPKTDRVEFWVRFVCGALFGAFIGIRLALEYIDRPTLLAIGITASILGFGFAAARYGDKFWHSIFRHWWLWS